MIEAVDEASWDFFWHLHYRSFSPGNFSFQGLPCSLQNLLISFGRNSGIQGIPRRKVDWNVFSQRAQV